MLSQPDNSQEMPLYRWASLRSELLWVYAGPVALNVTADHRRGYWCWLLQEGAVQVQSGTEVCRARAGQWIVSPGGIVSQTFAPGSRILSVHFRCEWPSGENLFAGRDGTVAEAVEWPRLERAGETLRRLTQRHFPRAGRQQFSLQTANYKVYSQFQKAFARWLDGFTEMFSFLGRKLAQAGDNDPRVYQAVQFLQGFPLDEPFPAEKLQRETGLGLARLDQLFSREMGLPARRYWNRLRARSAMQALEETSLSAKEISCRVGFKQASHFSKWFCSRAGATPRAFRAETRRNRSAGNI